MNIAIVCLINGSVTLKLKLFDRGFETKNVKVAKLNEKQ